MDTTLIDEIAKWRMGTAFDSPIFDWRDDRLNFDTVSRLDGGLAGGVLVDTNGLEVCCPPNRQKYDPKKPSRFLEAAEDVWTAWKGQLRPLSVFMVMNDARLFPLVEYLGPRTTTQCVQLSFSRTIEAYWREHTQIVLWPLSDQTRDWKIPDFTLTPWEQRRAAVLWRGQASGLRYKLAQEARPILDGIGKLPNWLDGWLKEEAAESEEVFWSGLGEFQRLLAVEKCRKLEFADVRFVPFWDGDRRSIDVAARYLGRDVVDERTRLTAHMERRQKYKYLLTIPGNDYPSSLRADLLSGGLVLMPKPFWECTWFFGLKPNEHYIPLRADLSDFEETVQWCQDNDAQCKEIADAGRTFALKHFDPALERAVQSRVVERLSHNCQPV